MSAPRRSGRRDDDELSLLARLRARAAAERERAHASDEALVAPDDEDWALEDDADPVRHRLAAPKRVGEHLGAYLQRRGWAERLGGASLSGEWERVVGPELARVSEPVRLAGGVLVVRVVDQVWATQLRYLLGRVRDAANGRLGAHAVREVRLVVGRLEGPDDASDASGPGSGHTATATPSGPATDTDPTVRRRTGTEGGRP